MKKPVIRKSTTFELKAKDLHTPKGVSETVPDMAMSLKTILDRHTRGLEIPSFKPQYSDEEIPDLKRLDLTEIQNLKEFTKAEIADKTKVLQKAKFTQPKAEPKKVGSTAPTTDPKD